MKMENTKYDRMHFSFTSIFYVLNSNFPAAFTQKKLHFVVLNFFFDEYKIQAQ